LSRKNKIVNFRAYGRDLEKVDEKAAEKGQTRSQFIRKSLKESLSKEDRDFIDLNPRLKAAFEEFESMDIYSKRWTTALLAEKSGTEAGKHALKTDNVEAISKEYLADLKGKNIEVHIAKASCEANIMRAGALADVVLKELKATITMMFDVLNEEMLKEFRVSARALEGC